MQLFSEDYLMHYGVKGMKWKKHKKNTVNTVDPSNDLYDAMMDVSGKPHGGEVMTDEDNRWNRKVWTDFRRNGTSSDGIPKDDYVNLVYGKIRQRRRERLSNERRKAYEANSERVRKQQHTKTVKKVIQKLKNKNKRRSRPTTNAGGYRRNNS